MKNIRDLTLALWLPLAHGCGAVVTEGDGWRRVSEVDGCVTYGGRNTERHAVVRPELERNLLSLLPAQYLSRGGTRCWYEVGPDKLRLEDGGICVSGIHALFGRHDEEWRLENTEFFTSTCHERQQADAQQTAARDRAKRGA
jgi:hypothetical protein